MSGNNGGLTLDDLVQFDGSRVQVFRDLRAHADADLCAGVAVVIPDVHLLDKGPKDDFCDNTVANRLGLASGFYETRFLELLQFLGRFKDEHGSALQVVQIGDLYDLWQEPQGPNAIHEAYVNVLGFFDELDPTYVIGNHDIDLWRWYASQGKHFNRRWHQLLQDPGGQTRVVCEHGFQADFFNNQAQWSGAIGQGIAQIVGMAEYIDPNLDVLLGTAADNVLRAFAMYNAGLTPVENPDQYKSHEYTAYYKAQVGKFRSGNSNDARQCQQLTCAVIGHTHRPRLVKQPADWGDFFLMDCGSWVNGGHEFGVIAGRDIAVCQWGP